MNCPGDQPDVLFDIPDRCERACASIGIEKLSAKFCKCFQIFKLPLFFFFFSFFNGCLQSGA